MHSYFQKIHLHKLNSILQSSESKIFLKLLCKIYLSYKYKKKIKFYIRLHILCVRSHLYPWQHVPSFLQKYDLNNKWELAKNNIFKTIILRKLFLYSLWTDMHKYTHGQVEHNNNGNKQYHHNFISIWLVI